MGLEFTPAASRAVAAAERWASQFGAAEVEALHLLLGLLDEEESRAAALLVRSGLDLPAARRALSAGSGGTQQDSGKPAPLSTALGQLLQKSRVNKSDRLVDRAISSDQILLALLQPHVGLLRQLESHGLKLNEDLSETNSGAAELLPVVDSLILTDTTGSIDWARLVDASANRAREGLRVVEDYCRFALDDAFLSGECKRLRHDLAACLSTLPPGLLLEARETQRDVGTRLSTAREYERPSLLAVVEANCKRLQEALRSLEEFAKIQSPTLGQELESLRYRVYTLERALVLGSSARHRLLEARLYVLVSGSGCKAALDWTIREAVAGGAQIIQLREKQLADRALLERARLVRRLTREAGVLFVMNDRPDLARLSEADGVHVGQEELPVKEARRIIGPEALIGVSTHSIEQVRQAILDGASYIGVGPTFSSGTKRFEEFPGLEFVSQATAETSLPAFVIGGITPATIEAAVEAGARRVAVSQALCQAEDPRRVAEALRRALER